MRSADDNLNLGRIPKRLLRFQYLVTMRLKCFRLQIDADKREVIRSVVNRKPDFAQCTHEIGICHIGHIVFVLSSNSHKLGF